MIPRLHVRARGHHFQIGRVDQTAPVARRHQHGTGIDLGALEQTLQRQIGYRGHIVLLGQLKGQPAEHGGRIAHALVSGLRRCAASGTASGRDGA